MYDPPVIGSVNSAVICEGGADTVLSSPGFQLLEVACAHAEVAVTTTNATAARKVPAGMTCRREPVVLITIEA